MSRASILIEVQGGVVTRVVATEDIDVVVIDYDSIKQFEDPSLEISDQCEARASDGVFPNLAAGFMNETMYESATEIDKMIFDKLKEKGL